MAVKKTTSSWAKVKWRKKTSVSRSIPKETHKTWTTIKLYFLLISITWVIGSLITLGILLFSVAQKVIISDQDYIIAERYYELDQCEQDVAKPIKDYRVPSGYYEAEPRMNYEKPTEEEIEKCKAEKTEQLILSRNAGFNTEVLWASIRAILFLILLFTHYPRFMVENRRD